MDTAPRIIDRDASPAQPKNFGVRADGHRTSNLAATLESHDLSGLSAAEQATAELLPMFESIGLGHKCAAVASSMCKQRHRTWKNGVEGLAQWQNEDGTLFNSMLQDRPIGMGLPELSKLNAAIHAASAVAMGPTKCVVRVRCEEVELKLTLTPKFLGKPLADALVTPFLKAFAKRTSREATVSDVERVQLGSRASVDITAVGDALLRDERGVLEAEAEAVIILRCGSAASEDGGAA